MNSTQSRRWLPISAFAILLFIGLVIIYSPAQSHTHTVSTAPQAAEADGYVKTVLSIATVTATAISTWTLTETETATFTANATTSISTETALATATASMKPSKPSYFPGKPEKGKEYSRGIVVASMQKENTSWVGRELPDLDHYIYVVDDPDATFTVPKNWGNELMVYLTYIIDHYDKLPDISIFVHAHERTHHNPQIFNHETAPMIKALNSERIIRDGYMNLACGIWDEGKCTAQIRPAEEKPGPFHKQAFEELFPEYQVPQILGAACCSQFATSAERIQQVPLEKWTHYRQWLLSSYDGDPRNYTNGNPGYVWEYLWQYVLGGEQVFCPASHWCYCDGYGVCFGGRQAFKHYIRLARSRNTMMINIHEIDALEEALADDGEVLDDFDRERRANMQETKRNLEMEMDRRVEAAFDRGRDPKLRAAEEHLD